MSEECKLPIALCITAFGAVLCIIAAIGRWYTKRGYDFSEGVRGKYATRYRRGQVEEEYDDLLPVCLYQDKLDQWHLLDRHNDEIATFDPAIEKEDMERIVALINRKEK